MANVREDKFYMLFELLGVIGRLLKESMPSGSK